MLTYDLLTSKSNCLVRYTSCMNNNNKKKKNNSCQLSVYWQLTGWIWCSFVINFAFSSHCKCIIISLMYVHSPPSNLLKVQCRYHQNLITSRGGVYRNYSYGYVLIASAFFQFLWGQMDRQYIRRETVPALHSVPVMQVIITVTLPGYIGNNCGDIPPAQSCDMWQCLLAGCSVCCRRWWVNVRTRRWCLSRQRDERTTWRTEWSALGKFSFRWCCLFSTWPERLGNIYWLIAVRSSFRGRTAESRLYEICWHYVLCEYICFWTSVSRFVINITSILLRYSLV